MKLARVWFAGVKKAEADRPAAARLISTVCSRFRDELGYEATLKAFDWVKWTDLADNVAHVRPRRPAARVRPRLQPGRRHLDQLPAGGDQGSLRARPRCATTGSSAAIWEAEGKQRRRRAPRRTSRRSPRPAQPLFTKPVTINFRSGKSELDGEAMAALNQQRRPAGADGGAACTSASRATPTTSATTTWNQGLSERRAQAIVDYLVSRGVDRAPDRRARATARRKPLASNKTPEGRARNRRTDILFIPAGAGT